MKRFMDSAIGKDVEVKLTSDDLFTGAIIAYDELGIVVDRVEARKKTMIPWEKVVSITYNS